MNTEHTPGPWCWDDKDALPWTDYDKTDHMPYLINANGSIVMSGEDIRINNAANASLITAAPDLLAALKALTSNPHVNLGDLVYKVRDSEGEGWDGPHVKHWSDAVQAARAAIAKAEGKA